MLICFFEKINNIYGSSTTSETQGYDDKTTHIFGEINPSHLYIRVRARLDFLPSNFFTVYFTLNAPDFKLLRCTISTESMDTSSWIFFFFLTISRPQEIFRVYSFRFLTQRRGVVVCTYNKWNIIETNELRIRRPRRRRPPDFFFNNMQQVV